MLGARPVILGVQTTVLRDSAFDKALIVEDTLDYFAQDVTGNVWYLGEDVTSIDSMSRRKRLHVVSG